MFKYTHYNFEESSIDSEHNGNQIYYRILPNSFYFIKKYFRKQRQIFFLLGIIFILIFEKIIIS